MPETDIVTCAQCGAANRIPLEKLERQGVAARCGRCKAALSLASAAGTPVVVTDGSFAEVVGGASVPVLLDMWAPWCGPCRMIAPLMEEIAREYSGRIRVAKMNVDENPRTSAQFGIQSIPALLVLRGGVEIDRLVGAQPKPEIVRRLQRVLA